MAVETSTESPTPAGQQICLPQLDGVFVLNKPSGPSSAQCIAKIKRLGQKKIGHAGTLDPMAEGVLLVLLGQATKLSSYLLAGGVKVYSGLMRLGVETDTWDAEGDVVAERPWQGVETDEIRAQIAAWTQLEEQDVPPYSAAKHKGRPLYKLARNGLDLPKKTKDIKIFKADVLSIDPPWIRFRVICASGVYIRSLAHSLGKRLGCGAALFGLTREHSHPFSLEQACPLADVLANPALLPQHLRGLGDALPDWPQIRLTPQQAAMIRNGRSIAAAETGHVGDKAILCDNGSALALASLQQENGGNFWTVLRGLWH